MDDRTFPVDAVDVSMATSDVLLGYSQKCSQGTIYRFLQNLCLVYLQTLLTVSRGEDDEGQYRKNQIPSVFRFVLEKQ